MRLLFRIVCLFVLGACTRAQAAIVFMDLEDRGLTFSKLESSIPRIPLDFLPGEGSLWLVPSTFLNYYSLLVSQGPIRVVTTIDPPPNIGGLVAALDPGTIIGPDLVAPRDWHEGEPPSPDNGDRNHLLFEGAFTPPPSEFYRDGVYIGLEFEIDGEVHYGWLSTALEPGDYPISSRPAATRITGFAYETEPGVPIIAGAVPEPGTTLLLIFGTGVLWIRRRNSSNHHGGSFKSPPQLP